VGHGKIVVVITANKTKPFLWLYFKSGIYLEATFTGQTLPCCLNIIKVLS
jgi:hypothetical protein